MSPARRAAGLATTLGAALLAACASDTPKPLDADVAAVLASPDRAALARQAGTLQTPALPPVKLDFSQPLSGDEIAALAVLANPDLRALRSRQGVAEAQVFAAGLLPDPQLSLGVDRVMAPSGQGLVDAYSGGLSLDLLGALASRELARDAARHAAEQVRLDIAWQEWATAGQARLLALRLPLQRHAAALARQSATLADRALQRTLQAAADGDVKADEILTRRLAAADADSRALAAQRDAETTRLDLNRVLGLRPDESLQLAAPPAPAAWPAPEPQALFAAAREHRLDLQALQRGYASQQDTLRRAILGQYPRLSITLNRARDTSAVHSFGPSIALDLPIWNRNRGAIATARAEGQQLRSEYAARLFQTRADIYALVAALNRDEAARLSLADQLPALRTIAAHTQSAADRGDLTQTDADAASAALLDKQLAELALQQSCAEQRLALRLAVGAPLSDTETAE